MDAKLNPLEALPTVRMNRAAALGGGAHAATTDTPLPTLLSRAVVAPLSPKAPPQPPLPPTSKEKVTATPAPYKIQAGEDGGDESGDDAVPVEARARRKRRKSTEKRRLAKGQIGLCTEASQYLFVTFPHLFSPPFFSLFST